MLISRYHPGQKYSTLFETKTGFFARIEDQGHPEPLWSEAGPELMDISVTNWCDQGCSFCYRRSDTAGTHMALSDYQSLMQQAAKAGVLQVALGGGNPNQHPEFERILRVTRQEFGIVPSYTTNGRGLSRAVLAATKRTCGAVAVSAYEPFLQAGAAIRKLLNAGVKTNVHYILSAETVDTALTWLHSPPEWLDGINALIFLNFKPITRDGKVSPLAKYHPRIAEFLRLATSNKFPFKIGFDDCTATGILTFGHVEPVSLEACDSARFSMFVSERMQAYPCSFMAELCEGHPVNEHNLIEIWRQGELFVKMRESLSATRCGGCGSGKACLSGCSLFPEMNICNSTTEVSPVRKAMNEPAHGITINGKEIVR